MSFLKIKNLIRHAIVFTILIIIQIFSWLRGVNINLWLLQIFSWPTGSTAASGCYRSLAYPKGQQQRLTATDFWLAQRFKRNNI